MGLSDRSACRFLPSCLHLLQIFVEGNLLSHSCTLVRQSPCLQRGVVWTNRSIALVRDYKNLPLSEMLELCKNSRGSYERQALIQLGDFFLRLPEEALFELGSERLIRKNQKTNKQATNKQKQARRELWKQASVKVLGLEAREHGRGLCNTEQE